MGTCRRLVCVTCTLATSKLMTLKAFTETLCGSGSGSHNMVAIMISQQWCVLWNRSFGISYFSVSAPMNGLVTGSKCRAEHVFLFKDVSMALPAVLTLMHGHKTWLLQKESWELCTALGAAGARAVGSCLRALAALIHMNNFTVLYKEIPSCYRNWWERFPFHCFQQELL